MNHIPGECGVFLTKLEKQKDSWKNKSDTERSLSYFKGPASTKAKIQSSFAGGSRDLVKRGVFTLVRVSTNVSRQLTITVLGLTKEYNFYIIY